VIRRSGTTICFAYTRRAIALTTCLSTLRRGRFEPLHAFEVSAYGREGEGDAVVVVFNAGRETQTVTLDVEGFLPDGSLEDVWSRIPGRVSRGYLRGVELPPRSAAVFVR
jgi:hypothetical protein